MISSTNGMAASVSASDELRQKQEYYERVVKEGGFSCDQSPPAAAFIIETQKLRLALATIRSVIATQRSGMSDVSIINLQEVCLDIADMIAERVK